MMNHEQETKMTFLSMVSNIKTKVTSNIAMSIQKWNNQNCELN